MRAISFNRALIGAIVGLAIAAGLGLAGCGNIGLPVLAGGGSTTGTPSTTGNPAADSGGTSAEVNDHCVQAGSPASATQQQMFQALNDYRVSQGVARLVYSKVLETAASAQAHDMYNRHFFAHTNPDGQGPLERATAAGFCRIRSVGENIAWNQPSVAEVQTGWEHSPGHNANMINPGYRYVGMGYYASPDGPYWVQVFGNVFP